MCLKKIKTALLLTVVFSVFAPSLSHASIENNLSQFFHRIEGHWNGGGTIRELDAEGKFQQTSYKMELRVAHGSEGSWNLSEQLNTENSTTFQRDFAFTIQNEQLLASDVSSFEPVLIIDSSPMSLTYFMRRADIFNGRFFEFTIHYEFDEASGSLSGQNTILLNGVMITEGNYSINR